MDVRRAAALGLTVLILAACDAQPSGEAPAPNGEAPAPTVFFPITVGLKDGMQALSQGTLVERDGCLFLENAPYTALLLWPGGFSVERVDDGSLQVHDASGATRATVGKPVRLVGGFLSEARDDTRLPERVIGEPIPARCKAQGYWAITSVLGS